MRVDQLDTPIVIVDIDKLETNISQLQAYLNSHNIDNRPHIKTHKIPEIAHMQIAAGAVGITSQKLSEAEIMIQAGIRDIFIPYNIVGRKKLERLVALARQCWISVTADTDVVVYGLSDAFSQADMMLPVLVECETGLERCGVQTPQEAVELAKLIASSPGLTFGGLMTYPGSEQANAFIRDVKARLAEDGITVERVSVGGTQRMWHAHTSSETTEYRAGEYVFGDRQAVRSGVMAYEDCALKVFVTVVSRPTVDRGIIDGGSKTFSSDALTFPGYGTILEYPEAQIYALSEEHGHVDFSQCRQKPQVGERLTVIPNHCCSVTNLFDQVIGARNDTVEVVWKVAGRGTVQ